MSDPTDTGLPAPGLTRIVARPVPWPSLRKRSARAGLRLRWDALTEDGELLAAATEWPLQDGAFVLGQRGVSPDALVTMRHYDESEVIVDPYGLGEVTAHEAARSADVEKFVQAARAGGIEIPHG